MKTPQQCLEKVFSNKDLDPVYISAIYSFTPRVYSDLIMDLFNIAAQDYAQQFIELYKNQVPDAGKQFDFPENTPEPGTRVLALTTSQGWQILHRVYSSHEEQIWMLSATSQRYYSDVIKWQHLPPLT